MRDKAAVGADLYIEDSPSNVEALRAKGLATVVFANSTNPGLAEPRADSWHEVEKIVGRELTHRKVNAAADSLAGH